MQGLRLVADSLARGVLSPDQARGAVMEAARFHSTELDRAEGFRYLTRLLRLGLESKLEYSDTDFPGLYALSHTTAKIGADNPDNIYHNSTIDGTKEYRLKGTRGTVPYFSWGTKANRYTTDGTMASTGELLSHSLVTEPDDSE